LIEIKLANSTWTYDPAAPLGPPGGFGEVFKGTGDNGAVAVKRLKITADAAAYREMKMGEFLVKQDLEHVVPVLDFGQDAQSDAYYLVMPVCEFSLQDYLSGKGKLDWTEARDIALEILSGLKEVADVVHRDLKPGNVLFHEGRWKLADFGIAKFVADSTSLRTLRDSLTPSYGAPEQWRMEAPQKGTDIYALGCIMHAMVDGLPPFSGSVEEVRQAHLTKAPPELANAPPRLASLVSSMLRKPPESRPTADRSIAVLAAIENSAASPAVAALASAGQKIAAERSRQEAAANEARQLAEQRKGIGEAALKELGANLTRLANAIRDSADADVARDQVILGNATLGYNSGLSTYVQIGDRYQERVALEIFAQSYIMVSQLGGRVPYSFSATLFYGRTGNDQNLRWREVGFWSLGQKSRDEPYALEVSTRPFADAFMAGLASTNVAFGPLVIDDENEGEFHDRWMTLFARAADGQLARPMQMPVPMSYFVHR
jgi:hypothetical protein